MCPFGNAVIERRTHVVRECGMYEEERDAIEEDLRETEECGMQEFGTLDSRTYNDRYPRRKMVATGGETGRGS